MSDVIRKYPFVTPDTIRQKLHIDEALFDLHVKRSYMREQTNGTKYVGTVENWGSELLLESHKLKTTMAPFQTFESSDCLRRFFDLHYDDDVSSYHQPGAIVACLKKNVLIDEKSYITFPLMKRHVILRSKSYSDTRLVPQTIFETTNYPFLYIHNPDDTVTIERIILKDTSIAYDEKGKTHFYYNTTSPSASVISAYNTTPLELEKNMIDPESWLEVNGEYTFNVPLKRFMEEMPLIWMSVPRNNTYPTMYIDFSGNLDRHNDPLLTFGTDGNNKTHLFPFVSGINNLPEIPAGHTTAKWMIKVYAKYDDFVSGESSDKYSKRELRKIKYVGYDTDPFTDAFCEYDITWDNTKYHVFINTSNERMSVTKWEFHVPAVGESDYDGTTYINPPYMCPTDNDGSYDYSEACVATVNDEYTALFDVIPEYGYIKWKHLTPWAHVGVHIDYSSDYSDNAVDKKNGTIYKLGDFDGIPTYYKNKHSRRIKRARAELYALREWIQTETEHPMLTQTAALLIDSGQPLYDSNDDISDMTSYIHYAFDPSREYKTEGTPEDLGNVLSDIVYVSGNDFGDVMNPSGFNKGYQMIYHGNRYFSISKTGLGEINKGRVYVLSNDPSEYDNNSSTSYTKPARTFARICDIPTDYRQLSAIHNTAPPLIIDKSYVRTEICYGSGNDNDYYNDLEKLWNLTDNELNMFSHFHDPCKYVATSPEELNNISTTEMEYWCRKWKNRNSHVEIANTMATDYPQDNVTWTVANGGDGYVEGHMLKDYVAGRNMTATVSGVDASGGVTETTLNEEPKQLSVNLANFDNRITTYEPVFSQNSSWSGETNVQLQLEIDQNYWNSLQPSGDGIIDGVFSFVFNNDLIEIWVWDNDEYTWKHHVNLTGANFTVTTYNENLDIVQNSTATAIIYKALNSQIYLTGFDDAPTSNSITSVPTHVTYPNGSTTPNDPSNDFSNDFVERGFNAQDSYFVLDENDGETNTLTTYRVNSVNVSSKPLIFPKTHRASLYNYYPTMTSLMFSGFVNEDGMHGYVQKQPNVYVFNPLKTKHVYYTQISSDVVEYVGEKDITFGMIDNTLTNYDQEALKKNVYKYDITKPAWIDKYEWLKGLSRDILYASAVNEYGLTQVQYAEEYGVPYSHEMLVDAILQVEKDKCNKTVNESIYVPSMKSTPIRKIGSTGSTVDVEQPSGDVVPLSSFRYNNSCIVNNPASTNLTRLKKFYFFKIPDDAGIDSLQGFKLKDQLSNQDVSDLAVILYKGILYSFIKDTSEWLPIHRKY